MSLIKEFFLLNMNYPHLEERSNIVSHPCNTLLVKIQKIIKGMLHNH